MKVKVLAHYFPYKPGDILEVEKSGFGDNNYLVLESDNPEHKIGCIIDVGHTVPQSALIVSNPSPPETIALKYDNGKPDLSDIPLEAMLAMGAAFSYGQKKYAKNNFRNGHKVSKLLAAATRHIYQHLDGQTLDSESNQLHLGHAMASLAMAIYSFKTYPENDDRFKPDLDKWHKENIAETERVKK